ncbi:MAG: pyruvate kinase, partial [Arthrobacter sp.]|nr:pyruvate kinase [Arthrobacter sp.]
MATFGPAIASFENTLAVLEAGVDVARMNMSHGDYAVHDTTYENVRKAAGQLGKPVGIMADLQGPKIRVGKFAQGKVMLEPGAAFVLDAARSEPGDLEAVGLDYKSLPRDVKPGDTLLLNDGLIVMTVNKVVGPAVHTTVKLGGELYNNKGINKQGGGLTAPALTAKDMEAHRGIEVLHVLRGQL